MPVAVEGAQAVATIAAAGSLSDVVEIGAYKSVGLHVPTLTAAFVTFDVSCDNGVSYAPMRTPGAGTEFSIASSTHGFAYFFANEFAAFTHMKVRSGTAAAPVAQAGGAAIKVSLGN